ncbi:MAG: exo-alpha-sialidase, partial [Myxococcales bacterium]|nr:exo-alpha-sialidase [Myxococcales bacterium]
GGGATDATAITDTAPADVIPADTATTDTGGADVTVTSGGWRATVVAEGGRQVRATTLPSGRVAAIAYADEGIPGASCGASGEAAATLVGWDLSYAERGADGAWAVEVVARVDHLGPPRGADVGAAGDGAPVIAALAGGPSEQPPYCGANDLAIYERAPGSAGFSPRVVVAESDEAQTGEPASDYGTVVGLWPAIAKDPDGRLAVAYKDVHAGSLQGDDFARADLELVWEGAGGGLRHLAVDPGVGAGNYNGLVFDADGRPVVMTFNPRDDVASASRRGLWLWRSGDDGATWESVRLTAGGTGERPAIAWDADGGTVWVAWYDAERGLPMVAHLVDDAAFASLADGWEVEDVGDHVFDEGAHPALAVTADGQVALAWYRCGRASDGVGNCSPQRDGVVFAYRDGGEQWVREVVDDGGADGVCGGYIALAFAGGDTPVLLYQCLVPDGAGGYAARLVAATGDRL